MKTEYKEITVKEALKLLYENDAKPVEGLWFWDDEPEDGFSNTLITIRVSDEAYPFVPENKNWVGLGYSKCGYKIETPETTKEWLETLPDGYRELALKNNSKDRLEEKHTSLSSTLVYAFGWQLSPEPAGFWSAADKWAKDPENNDLPPLPTGSEEAPAKPKTKRVPLTADELAKRNPMLRDPCNWGIKAWRTIYEIGVNGNCNVKMQLGSGGEHWVSLSGLMDWEASDGEPLYKEVPCDE